MKKRKPIAIYGWCVAHEGIGPIWPSFAETRKEAVEKFCSHAGMPLKALPLYYAVKVYIATAKA